jgi:phospholipid transport system substrate-binding protein
VFSVLVSLVVLTAVPAGATPMGVVKSADTEIDAILASPAPTAEKLAARADDFIDFVELARRALGREWASLSKRQQDDFSSTMKGVLRASYAQRALSDGRGGAKVEYGEEKVDGNEATVGTTLRLKEDAFPIVYRLFRPNAKVGWKIYDVVTDEVSLVSTYSDQFRQVIAKKGFEGLLKSLKAKREQLEAPTKK